MEITAQRLFYLSNADVQFVYIQNLAKCFLIFENPFIILKSIFIFINSISVYWSSFKAFVGVI